MDLQTSTEHVERITKDDGETYVRIPGNEDSVDEAYEATVGMLRAGGAGGDEFYG